MNTANTRCSLTAHQLWLLRKVVVVIQPQQPYFKRYLVQSNHWQSKDMSIYPSFVLPFHTSHFLLEDFPHGRKVQSKGKYYMLDSSIYVVALQPSA